MGWPLVRGRTETGAAKKKARTSYRRPAAQVLLDGALCAVAVADYANATRRRDAEWHAEDVRLLAHRGQLVATAVLTPEVALKDVVPQRFGVYELVLGVDRASARLLAAFEAPPRTFFDDGDAGATQCWNQSPVDGRPGISSNPSTSLKSNSFYDS